MIKKRGFIFKNVELNAKSVLRTQSCILLVVRPVRNAMQPRLCHRHIFNVSNQILVLQSLAFQ
jgi:hypothetical protein